MTKENNYKSMNGFAMLLLVTVLLAIAITCFILQIIPLAILALLCFIILLPGFFVINPNEAKVFILFGDYKGTGKDNGFFWTNPFFTKKHISLRARNHNGQTLKVNDKVGNPIEIAAVIVWQVSDTAKAVFEVNDFVKYVEIQSEAAIRHLAGLLPYDNFEDESAVMTLRGGGEEVNNMLEKELNERLERAGIIILEARISHLAYAPEIAGAMLQRQQATAVVAARKQIVEGAVSMVELALEKLSQREIVQLDEEKKATMVSNLLVVLCGDKNVNPVINAGTLY